MLTVRIKQIKAFIWLTLFSFLSFFFPKNSWVISERGRDARDNGYHFYKFLKKTHPEIKVYFIIEKTSPDYPKVEADAVQYGSIRNYWVVATAKKLISSHYALCLPDIGSKLFAVCGLSKKFYFLQHGVIYRDLRFLHFENAPMKLFCCGAKPEYEFVKAKYGHPDGVVTYTGLARYDNLHNQQTMRNILVMPTWRQQLYGVSREEFRKSDYFIRWNEILQNPQLSNMLRENDLKLVFYPHYELQRLIDCFMCQDENIVIADFAHFDVQQLLIEARLLVTDYSSVFFDFAYMKKPCIYYQFDASAYCPPSEKKDYFDYSKNGFGDVTGTINEFLSAFKKCIECDFVPQAEYLKRMELFFELRDTHNCERIYNAIEALE